MIFQHTIDKVLSGEKTQTRRIRKDGQHGWLGTREHPLMVAKDTRPVYQVGKTYAAQPGRGKAQVARILITDIRLEDVRKISDADAKAEGFGDEGCASILDFLVVWTRMHDTSIRFERDVEHWDFDGTWTYQVAGETGVADDLVMLGMFRQRPADRYQAFALTFEVVK
jgi:hypothetical protein